VIKSYVFYFIVLYLYCHTLYAPVCAGDQHGGKLEQLLAGYYRQGTYVLRCVAACCSVLQRVAGQLKQLRARYYRQNAYVLQCVAVCCSVQILAADLAQLLARHYRQGTYVFHCVVAGKLKLSLAR